MITSMMAFCVRFVRTTDLIRHGDADIEQQDDLNKVPPLRPLRPCVDNCSTETLLADRFDHHESGPEVLWQQRQDHGPRTLWASLQEAGTSEAEEGDASQVH